MKNKFQRFIAAGIIVFIGIIIIAIAVHLQYRADHPEEFIDDNLQVSTDCTTNDGAVIGDGPICIYVSAMDNVTGEFIGYSEIHTDQSNLADALTEHNIIAGEDSTYGLYITEVMGVSAIYEEDGSWWAIYVNDQLAEVGASSIDVVDGNTYSFYRENG